MTTPKSTTSIKDQAQQKLQEDLNLFAVDKMQRLLRQKSVIENELKRINAGIDAVEEAMKDTSDVVGTQEALSRVEVKFFD